MYCTDVSSLTLYIKGVRRFKIIVLFQKSLNHWRENDRDESDGMLEMLTPALK